MVDNSHFDLIAKQYESSLPAHIVDHYLRKRVDFIKGLLPSGCVLDVGCGTGTIVQSLSEQRFKVFGVDLSIGMLEILEAKRSGFQVQADAMALPFSKELFNLVLSVATLHHFADPVVIRKSIFEMWRVVRCGGYLLIWDHNPRNLYWKLLMRRMPQDSGSERLIPRREIESVIGKLGSTVASFKVYNFGFIPDFIPFRLMDLAVKFETIAEKTPIVSFLSAHNVYLIKKV